MTDNLLLLRSCLRDMQSEGRIKYKENTLLSGYSSFKIGGEADIIAFPCSEAALCELISILKDNDIRFKIVGNCSNLLFADDGYKGCIVSTSEMKGIAPEGDRVRALCGTSLTALASYFQKNSLCGAEFLYGIPGSVGGAVCMNAGAYGGEIADVIDSVRCLDVETLETVDIPCRDMSFAYRHSIVFERELIVVSALFKLEYGDADEIKRLMDDYMTRRAEKQPLGEPSAGSVFKRYPGRYTGQMIEEAGLKGYRIGGAAVSEKHAGFIVNKGGASSDDVLCLIEHIKAVIKEKFGIEIECEMQYIPSGR